MLVRVLAVVGPTGAPVVGALVGSLAGVVAPAPAARLAGSGPGPPPRWICTVGGASCGAVLGWRLVPHEAAGALVFAAWLLLLAAGVVLAAIDLACLRLPDRIVLPLAGAVVGLLGAAALLGAGVVPLGRALAAGLLVGGGYAVLALLPRAGLGFGDVKLAALLGCALGWSGWRCALLGAVLPYALAGPYALVLLVSGHARRHSALAFGPWLLVGALLALFA